jgi:GNAT superfamily N-acetyltransferase
MSSNKAQNMPASHAPKIVVRSFVPAAVSDTEWRQYHDYINLRTVEDADDDWPVLSDVDRQSAMLKQWPLFEQHLALALIDGQIAGSSYMSRARPGRPDYELHAPFCNVSIGVRLAARRQGVAMQLLAYAADFMAANGQVTARCGTHFDTGYAFLAAIGAAEQERTIASRLDLAGTDWEELARWERAADGLTWEIHPSRLPAVRFEALAPAMNTLLNEALRGPLDAPPASYNWAQLAIWYAELEQRGGNHFVVFLLDGDQLAAVCEVDADGRYPERAFQNLTAVAAPWRGKGLAKAIKARMMRLIRETRPGIRMISTGNATVNVPMLAINRRLGFVPRKDVRSYQMSLDGIRAALARR